MSKDRNDILKIFEPYLGKTEQPAPKPETYVVAYGCGNCGRRSNIRFKKGDVAPEWGIKCPHCGTRRTRKGI